MESFRGRLWIKDHSGDRCPISNRGGPALRRPLPGTFIQPLTTRQDGNVCAGVSLVRSNVSDCAVSMLGVVPADKPSHPLTCGVAAGEGQTRISWRVLERAKQRLRIRV